MRRDSNVSLWAVRSVTRINVGRRDRSIRPSSECRRVFHRGSTTTSKVGRAPSPTYRATTITPRDSRPSATSHAVRDTPRTTRVPWSVKSPSDSTGTAGDSSARVLERVRFQRPPPNSPSHDHDSKDEVSPGGFPCAECVQQETPSQTKAPAPEQKKPLRHHCRRGFSSHQVGATRRLLNFSRMACKRGARALSLWWMTKTHQSIHVMSNGATDSSFGQSPVLDRIQNYPMIGA